MISKFRIRNFKSILDMEVDFKFNEGKAPNGYKELDNIVFLEPKRKERYIPCLAVYGANASGKSNIVKAFSTLKKISEEGIERLYFPNKLNTLYNSTTLCLDFFVNKEKYTYNIEYNQTEIVEETLLKEDEIIYKISLSEKNFNYLATDVYDKEKLEKIYQVECCDIDYHQKKTFLNKIALNFGGLNKNIVTVYNEIINNLQTYELARFSVSKGINELAKLQDNSSIKIAFEKIVSLLRKLDIDINRMELERTTDPITNEKGEFNFDAISDTDRYDDYVFNNVSIMKDQIYTYHKDTEGKEIKFSFAEESEGTRVVAGMLGIFMAVLEKGGTLIVDELERSLHPLLLTEVVRMFKDKRYNKNKAQLIFTAHNTDILDADLLRISEIAIVRKTLKQGTTIRSISSYEGMRNITNFRKQYLNGVFSGIPHPYI